MQSRDVDITGIRKNLNQFLWKLTDDGQLDFESVAYQHLKLQVGKEECANSVADNLFETARRSGCHDRKLILQLINKFFLQSSIFRNKILDDPSELLELFVETNPIRKPLPGSKKHGNELKAEAIFLIKNWENKYAKDDARIKCLVVTLKKTKFVDYENGDKKMEEEKRRRTMIEERKKTMIENTLAAYESKFHQVQEDIEKLSMELNTTMQMLVPSFTVEDPDSSNAQATWSEASTSRSSKLVEIIIPDLSPEVIVSSENDAIIESFLGAKRVLAHRVQTLRKIAKRLVTLKEPGEKLAEMIIKYRDGIKKLVLKADEVKIVNERKQNDRRRKRKTRFDDDFIDVDISIDDILMVQYAQKTDNESNQEGQLNIHETQDEDKKVTKKEEKIKTVPFGLDLKYWGEERKNVEVPKNNADCHRFWRSADESTISGTAHESLYTQRQFTFVGEGPKITRECLVKLPNGSLCNRKDFYKCPFHGKIVNRDSNGIAIHEKDRREANLWTENKQLQEAEEFSRKMQYSWNPKRKKKHDVEMTESQDVRNRLEKKLLDPKTIQRVSADVTTSRQKRLEKNFGHQFSHL